MTPKQRLFQPANLILLLYGSFLTLGFVRFNPGLGESNLLAGFPGAYGLKDLPQRAQEEGVGLLWLSLLYGFRWIGLSFKGILAIQMAVAFLFGFWLSRQKQVPWLLRFLLLLSPTLLVFWVHLSPLPWIGLCWVGAFYFWRKSPWSSILLLSLCSGLSFVGAIGSGVALLLLISDYFIGLSSGKTRPFTYGLGFFALVAFVWVSGMLVAISPSPNHQELRSATLSHWEQGLHQVALGLFPLANPMRYNEPLWEILKGNWIAYLPLILLLPLATLWLRGRLFTLIAFLGTVVITFLLSPFFPFSALPQRAGALFVLLICCALWEDEQQPRAIKPAAWWDGLALKSSTWSMLVMLPLALSGVGIFYSMLTKTYSPSKELNAWVSYRMESGSRLAVWPQHHAALLSMTLNRPVWSPGRENEIWHRDPLRLPADIEENELMQRLSADPKIRGDENTLLITTTLLNAHKVDQGGIVYADQNIYIRYLRNWAYAYGPEEKLFAAYAVQPNPGGFIKYRGPVTKK